MPVAKTAKSIRAELEKVRTLPQQIQKASKRLCVLNGAPEGTRTPNNGSEDHRDIHFTTGADRAVK